MPNPFLDCLQSLPRPDEIDYRYRSVSLFCGAGGLDLGLAFAGFEALFATDIAAVHCDTISQNFPRCRTLTSDITVLSADQIRILACCDGFDLMTGGPPCQAFSILGQRNSFHDARGRLVYEYVRLINELQPRAFLFENVPGLMTINKGKDWEALLAYFRTETGYRLFPDVLNAADFGIPQIRRRIFIVGFRSDVSVFEFPRPTHRNPNQPVGLSSLHLAAWLPAESALEDMDGLPNHRIRPHGERVKKRYMKLAPGDRDRIDHTDRIHPDLPSGTVLVGSQAGGGRPHIHPYEPRHISVREAARLQSFPDWFVFSGTETWQYRGVGNAVPPLLAKAIGEQIRQTLDELKA